MSRLFRRYVTLAVGTAGQEALRAWSDLQIGFSVKQDSRSKPNKAQIQVTNLTQESRDIMEEDNMTVVLWAGYTEQPPVLFMGDVADVSHKKSGGDWVTTIETGDGERSYQLSHVNQSFRAGVTNRQVLKKVVQATGLGLGHIAAIPEVQYTQGYVASGLTRLVLDDICQAVGAAWSIQDGALQVTNKDSGTNDSALLLSPETGLIGVPERKRTKGKKAKRNAGVKITSLLSPWVRPGRYIRLESEKINGFFLVKSVEHRGETKGPTFYTTMETTEVGGVRERGQTKPTQSEETLDIKVVPGEYARQVLDLLT